MGKDQFLKLFVTRLANQDPLSPMQDEDFIAQMAQFSQLEQLANMNANLEKAFAGDGMLSQTISNTMATSLIGKVVRVQTDAVALDESGTADIRFDLEEAAADITIEILDSSGTLVRALRPGGAPVGGTTISWDGLDTAGQRMPAGAYDIKVSAKDAEGEELPVRAYFSGTVHGVRYVDGAAMLMVNNAFIPLGSVMEVQGGE
jgi:flagellar basal-body rod modification protein FlgD